MATGWFKQSPLSIVRLSRRTLVGGAILEGLVLCGVCFGQASGAPVRTADPTSPDVYELATIDDSDEPVSGLLDMPPCPWFLDNNLGGASVGSAVTSTNGATASGVAQRFFPSVTGRLSHVGVWLRNTAASPFNAPRMTIWLEPNGPGSFAVPIASTPGAIVTSGSWQFVSFNFTPRVWVNNNSWVNSVQPHNYVFEVTTDTAGGTLEVRGETIGTYAFGSTLSLNHPSPRVPQIWACASLVLPPLVPTADVRFRTRICPATPPCPTSPAPDMNGDGFLDGRDYGIWFSLDPNTCFTAVDCNGDGVIDLFDWLCVLNMYANGQC